MKNVIKKKPVLHFSIAEHWNSGTYVKVVYFCIAKEADL